MESFRCETPPGYEESIYRQRLLKLQGRSSSVSGYNPTAGGSTTVTNTTPGGGAGSGKILPDKSILEEQEQLSAKAKAVFEASLRQYELNATTSTLGGGGSTNPVGISDNSSTHSSSLGKIFLC